jgi:hypothetical protein
LFASPGLLDRIAADPEFVSARILESADCTSVAAILEMRSVEDCQRLEQIPEVQEPHDELHRAANLVVRLSQQVQAHA